MNEFSPRRVFLRRVEVDNRKESMANHATIGGHPVHPMIIPFPIGLWVFSLIADVIYLWRGNPVWRDYIAFYTLVPIENSI